jgi:hypothetical protein
MAEIPRPVHDALMILLIIAASISGASRCAPKGRSVGSPPRSLGSHLRHLARMLLAATPIVLPVRVFCYTALGLKIAIEDYIH